MKRTMTILAFTLMGAVLSTPEARAGGGAAGEEFTKFSGPALNATVVLDPDFFSPGLGTVTIRVDKGTGAAGVIFSNAYVASFSRGCDGVNGAGTPLDPQPPLADLTNFRFLGFNWIADDVQAALLAPFGITFDPLTPLVFSNISRPVCTKVGDFWKLSFTGTMQRGRE